MLSDMTRATHLTRLVSLSVIATLFFAVVQPAWAEEEEEGGPAFKDPTIVTDDSTSTPDGVKDLGKKPEKKPINNPVYNEWWFWATAIGVAGALVALSVIPLQKKAPGCTSDYVLGCVGDGR
jgi:hypothetical protein